MDKNKIIDLQNKIIEGLKKSSLQMIETKKKNGQKIAVSVDGEIQIIKP